MKLPPILLPLLRTLHPVKSEAVAPASSGRPDPRSASVLVLLFPRRADISFLLTARPDTLSRHPGQISLPGGAVEPGDASLWETALRETREELGIRTGRVQPLGRLDTVTLAASNYLINPFVGWNPAPPRLTPDPTEVAEVIEVPLRALLDPSTLCEETWELHGAHWCVSYYQLQEKRVWGATARVLGDLAARLGQPGSQTRFVPGSVRPVSS